MEEIYCVGKTFGKQDFTQSPLAKGEYEDCTFSGCDFSYTNLRGYVFESCTFRDCNLSLAEVSGTAFREARFEHCKMLGLRLDSCNPFNLSFYFDSCQLDHASFYQLKIKGTVFKNVQLTGADFTECDLSGAMLEHCDLSGAVFDQCNLEKADLRTAVHYSIDPGRNRIKKARFSVNGIRGLLDHYDIRIED